MVKYTKDFCMELLKKILRTNSVSGYETDLKNLVMDHFEKNGLETKVSPLGNISAKKSGRMPFTVLFDAHYDQIGFVVQKIEKDGIMRIKNVGGIDSRLILGTELKVLGKKDLKGVVATKPPHLSSKEDRKKVPKMYEFLLDTGYSESWVNQNVEVGDPVVFDSEPFENGDSIFGPAIDNRAGLYLLLKLSDFLKNYTPENTVILRTTVQEEVGIRGASIPTEDICDLVVVIDATFANQHKADSERSFDSAKGPTLMFGPNYDIEATEKIEKLAKEKGIKTQREIEESVRGTNAYSYRVISGGHKLVGVSYPILNMHSPYEVVNKKLLDHTFSLLKGVAECSREDIL